MRGAADDGVARVALHGGNRALAAEVSLRPAPVQSLTRLDGWLVVAGGVDALAQPSASVSSAFAPRRAPTITILARWPGI